MLQLCAVLPQLVLALEHPVTVVRHCAARVFGMMARLVTTHTIHCLLERVLPLLGSTDDIKRRQGAIEATASILVQPLNDYIEVNYVMIKICICHWTPLFTLIYHILWGCWKGQPLPQVEKLAQHPSYE